jgi:Co/Zn/Cd efflux system component
MGVHCCEYDDQAERDHGRYWRLVLWIALAINAAMFFTEVLAGVLAGSVSLQADALDFLGDSANYAISLGVAGLALNWRARAALVKGATLVALGFWVLGEVAWHAAYGDLPEAPVMGIIGTLALIANGIVALILYGFRASESNMRSVWICSRYHHAWANHRKFRLSRKFADRLRQFSHVLRLAITEEDPTHQGGIPCSKRLS